jgi:hypothetical protein
VDCLTCEHRTIVELSASVALLCYAKYPPCCMATFPRKVRLERQTVTPTECPLKPAAAGKGAVE